jgi:ribosomal protein L20
MSGILLNRKMLSEIAVNDPKVFDRLVDIAKKSAKPIPAKV